MHTGGMVSSSSPFLQIMGHACFTSRHTHPWVGVSFARHCELPDPRQTPPGPWWWESAHALRAVRQFAWLEVGSDKVALSHPAHQRVTQTVRRLSVESNVLVEKSLL